MKNILVLMHDDPGQEARLQAALDLARALDGHLTCVEALPMPVVLGDFYGSAGVALMIEAERDPIFRERIEARLSREDVPWDWLAITADPALALADTSGLADLIIVNQRIEDNPGLRDIASSILVRTHTSVVAVPEDCVGFNAAGRVLIAWNGSRRVAATVQAVMPLLKLASGVQLFEVDDGSLETSARDAAAYLSRHGIHPTIRRVPAEGRAIDAVIREGCEKLQASYCLMGAFGHPRLAEALFGGVTHQMLKESKIPLLLGH